jgi:NAD(P)-dependent dehydrogenase (short-subunit alcohol dehydrogenase family)
MKKKFNIDNFEKKPESIAIVTGANSGLGFETAKALAGLNIKVILACRNTMGGEEARTEILQDNSQANLQVMHLDLASLKSVQNSQLNLKALMTD